MRLICGHAAALFVSLALASGATSAAASAPAVGAVQPSADWMALSMLTPSGTVGLSSAGVAAAQLGEIPAAPPSRAGFGTPPLPVIAVWLAVIAADIYLITRDHHHQFVPNSPA